MSLFRTALLALIFLYPRIFCAQQRDLDFSAEMDSVENPAQLPPDAMKLLLSDKVDFPNGENDAFRCTDREHPPAIAGEPEDQILCTALPLSSSPGKDYLVIGVGRLSGAHIVPFWIIHVGPDGPILLFKTRSDALSIRSRKYRGYGELVATFIFGAAGATIRDERYRFDGKRYKLFSAQETHN
jgi:hypothetical protein